MEITVSVIVKKMALIYLKFDGTLLLFYKVNLESDTTFFPKKNLKKFDWRPCSNIGTAEKLSERVIRPRVLKINLQPLAVKRVNKKQKQCSLFFKRARQAHSLIPVDVPILLKGCQSNFFSKFV